MEQKQSLVAEIICVGTELLMGQIVNTNAAFIGRELATLGVFSYHSSVVGDNPQRLKDILSLAIKRADVVILTGGLGPTYDDLTKETAASLFNRTMLMHQHSLERIMATFERMNRPLSDNNLKQAMMPEGAIVFDNDYGTAPALAIENGDKSIVLLPGPPREMQPIFEKHIKPYLLTKLNKIAHQTMVSHSVRIFGVGESAVEQRLASLMRNSTNPTIAPYAKIGEVELRVTATGKDEADCEKLIEPAISQIRDELGRNVYGIDVASLQEALVKLLANKAMTIATAESCTGGLIAKCITDVSGASAIFKGGAVTYSNEAKVNILGVDENILNEYGAVSEQVAAQMAKNVALRFNADIGISTTGIAGPIGGSIDKPVGLVYLGIYTKSDDTTSVKELRLGRGYADERDNIRHLASSNALFGVMLRIGEQ